MADNTHWVIVGSPDNFTRTREHGFSVQGLKSRHRKKAERMKPGDQIAWYVTGVKGFAGIARITSSYFEDHSRIWGSSDPKKADEDYPFRVKIEPETILPDGVFADAEPVARAMDYAKKWPAANWTLAFQGNVHEVSASDFALIREAIERAL